MDDIARRAGVGVGTVYRHFPTKEALVGEIVRRRFEELAEVAERWNAVEDPWAAFSGMIGEAAEQMAHDRTQQTVMWVASEAAVEHAAEAKAVLARPPTPSSPARRPPACCAPTSPSRTCRRSCAHWAGR